MEGVPPDIVPDVIMSKKGKGAKSRNKQKIDSGESSKLVSDSLNAKSVSLLVNKFESEAKSPVIKAPIDESFGVHSIPSSILSNSSPGLTIDPISNGNKTLGSSIILDGIEEGLKVSSNSLIGNLEDSSVVIPILDTPIKKEEGLNEGLSSPVMEFEKDIHQFCGLGEKSSMFAFWNSLSINEKEGFVHGLRFTKKKYNSGKESENLSEDMIDNVKKLSSVSQRNDLILHWKELSNIKKEKVFHKLCTNKVKKQVEANFGKNRIPFKSSSSLFPVSIEMKRSTELEVSAGLKKVGETIVNLLPEGVPVSEDNEPVIVELEKICSLQPLATIKKEKGKFEIDDMVRKQLEEVCNNIVHHFPSKFSHLDILKKGDFKFKYVDEELEDNEEKMVVDDNMNLDKNARNNNGGLLITEVMLEKAKFEKGKEKTDMLPPNSVGKDFKLGGQISYADKVSGKKLNAAKLISIIKKDPNLPNGVVEMPYSDILKGCSPFKTTLYGYFIDKHVNFFNVNKYAHNMWKKHGLEEVMVNDEGIYFFRFSSEQGMLSVLEGGVWMIFDSALVVRRWTTGVSSVKDQHDKVPVWVKVYNVPLEYWNGTGLSHIAWEIGKPLDVDAHTAKMCQEHWGRPAFMRILIEMSAEKEWLKEIHVYSSDLTTGERILSKCKIEYAWNPSKCSHCKVYGHKDSTCGILLAKEVKIIKSPISSEKSEEGIKIDLMEVLTASTKKVEVDNEGFQNVVIRNKGNNMGAKKTGETRGKSQNSFQGQNGKFQGTGKNGAGTNSGRQGQNGNNNPKLGNKEGNQWNKGKDTQGYNGENYYGNGSNFGAKTVQGQNSKNPFLMRKDRGTGAVSGKREVLGYNNMNCNIQDFKKKEEAGKKAVEGHKYVPNSGVDFKISSNFGSNFKTDKGIVAENFLSCNKFDALKDLDGFQDFGNKENLEDLYDEFGLDKSAYENYLNQVEVTDGITGMDTNMDYAINDD